MGIVHLAGPVATHGPGPAVQVCGFCETVIPPAADAFGRPIGTWERDILVTVEAGRATRGAERGAVRCSPQLLEPQEDGA